MVRSALSKVAWVGRTASMVFGLALVMALVMGVATMAFAENGANLILGSLNNTATAVTKLTGNVAGAEALHVSNPNTATNSTALSLNVASGKRPMTVNSKAKVINLNADQVDGKGAETFLGKTEKAADADKLDGLDSTAFYTGRTYITSTPGYVSGTANSTVTYGMPCEQGDVALSGGYQADPAGGTPTVVEDHTQFGLFEATDTGYVIGWKSGATPANMILFVECADLGQPLAASEVSSMNAAAPSTGEIESTRTIIKERRGY